jgi:uncharacterized protein (DUF697 family)
MDKSTIEKKISESLENAINNVSREREETYINENIPELHSVQSLISDYSNKNAVISGGAGLIPGPWGMAAAIPEIAAVTKNQISMIYDIGKAHGHNKIDNTILLGVLFGAMGHGATSLLIVQGQKVMAKRVGAKVIQTLISKLGGRITQQLVKSMAAKWLPVAGAIAMATWSKYSTNKIGEEAVRIFSKEIIEEETIEEITDAIIVNDNTEINKDNEIDILKIKILINLMKIDSKIDDKEMNFIEDFIDKINLTSDEKMDLISLINSAEKIKVDYTTFINNSEDALYLLIDLISLAKIDGKFDVTEKMFIKEIAKVLNFDKEDLKELIEDI